MTAAGRVGENTQTAYALALQFDLLPEELRAEAARRLAAEVKTRGHLTTGFVGTPYLCHVLSRYGHSDVAYQLLNRQEYPSWLYPVKQGATTIWERWDGQKPDGSFQDAGMNSFNHYAYGAIGEWMYRGGGRPRARPGRARLQARARPAAARRRPHLRRGAARDPLRRGGVGLVARRPEADRLGDGAAERARHGPPARGDARGRDGSGARGGGGARRERAAQDGEDVVVEVGSGRYRFEYEAARCDALTITAAGSALGGYNGRPMTKKSEFASVAMLLALCAFAGARALSQQSTAADRTARFLQMSKDAEARGLAEPFKGITTNGTVEPGLFPIRSTGVSTEPVRKAAVAFLAALTADAARPHDRSPSTTPSGASG